MYEIKKTLQTLVVVLLTVVSSVNSQDMPQDSLFLGQKPPGSTSKLFQLPVTSGFFAAERITISSDGKEIYYSEVDTYSSTAKLRIKYLSYHDNKWNGPSLFLDNYMAPAFSPDNKTIYFQDRCVQPIEGYYSSKNNTGWEAPSKLFNNPSNKHYLQRTGLGNYYVSANPAGTVGGMDICKININGTDTTIQSLGLPINTVDADFDFYVARDESYMIISIGTNTSALFVSYKKNDGSWTNPKNLGSLNNSSTYVWGPFVTDDNRYLFFSKYPATNNNRIYWVKIDNVVDSLRHTNFIPYAKSQINKQETVVNLPFNFKIPDSVFVDDDGNETLTYSATLSDGKSLPAWLSFDPAAKKFSGTPNEIITYSIKVTATDAANASVFTTFNLYVKELNINYFGQTPPQNKAILFTQGKETLSTRLENAGVFSRDGNEFYFSVMSSDWINRVTYVRKFINGKWTDEESASFSSIPGGSTETFINKENNRIIFPSSDGTFTQDGWIKTDFWTVKRTADGWGTPKKLGNTINDIDVQWHPTISDSGRMYFGSRGFIYAADQINDTTYGTPSKINDNNINMAGFSNADPFISPDEKYMIFSSNRSGGYGNNDLYISYKLENNKWTKAVNLGSNINSAGTDFSSYVTPDGKYLLFARDSANAASRHLYWVSTNFIDSLKQVVTGVESKSNEMPAGFNLMQNYPNPFNPSTNISYSIPYSSWIKLKIYDINGKSIKTLLDKYHPAGSYSVAWDGRNDNNETVCSGIYLYRLENNYVNLIRKMILLR